MESYPTTTDKDFLLWLLAATSNEAKMLPLDHLQWGKKTHFRLRCAKSFATLRIFIAKWILKDNSDAASVADILSISSLPWESNRKKHCFPQSKPKR